MSGPTEKTDASLMGPPQPEIPAAPPRPQSPAPAVLPSPSTAPASTAPPAAQAVAEPAPKPQLVPISYNGVEFKVTPEVAEAWQHRQGAFDSGYKKAVEERDAAKKQAESAAKPAEPTEEERREQLATRLLTEPDKVFAEEREKTRKELIAEYQGDISAREFQVNWWSKNHELLPHREVFDALLLANANKYIKEGLSDSQAYDRNAETLRKWIIGIRGNANVPARPADQHVEEPAPPSGAAPVSEPAGEGSFMSMSDSLKARRARKLEASLHPAARTIPAT